ncbi:hypothetical protein KIH39_18835 [Telmatocola sphagniphila]|uniref:Uncharacterized protein n=1 Tax=Telmatocola sphagniphila TaxID=1123043 RepID=A0A8E6EU72_9BACT|nr:hypothetical protein [Telmatocola sphagniphila]QVL30892.1 hypothetical protein KIH39_18835 [Telmatocola sphagniphila]
MNAAIFFTCLLLADTPVEPIAHWQGKVADDSLQKIAPTEGYIANAQLLEKLWKAWRPKEEVPSVDFKKELIILGVIPGPNSIGIVPSVDDKGDLKFTLQSTEIGGPGFGYHLVQIKREGVKTINGKPIDDKKNAPAKGDLTALEQKLVGSWIGHGPCVGNSVFQPDGTYHRSNYGPGAGMFETGTWKMEWSELPPTLVLTPSPTKGHEAEESFKVYVVTLNDKQFDYRWTKYSNSRIENHLRGTELDNVKIRLSILDSATQRYLGNTDLGAGVNYPPHLKTLVDKKILRPEALLDPWGKEFKYDVTGKRSQGKGPDIWTETPDKKIIANWLMKE